MAINHNVHDHQPWCAFPSTYSLLSTTRFLVASAFIYLSSQTSTPAQAAWYNTGGTWLYRKPITIDHTKVSGVASSTLSSFPVLVSVTDTQLKSTSNGGLVASSTGADILFTKSDGTTLLDYEIESYASTTGQLIAWINIPILSAVTDTTIYEYFGNASAPAETPGNITGTWDTNYKGVWHMKETLTGANQLAYDSTSNAVNATSTGSWTSGQQLAGKVGGSLNFVGSTGIYLHAISAALSVANVTAEAWVNSTTTSGVCLLDPPIPKTSPWPYELDITSTGLADFTIKTVGNVVYSELAQQVL